MSDDTPGHVLATYREIADHFRLGSVRAARTKVKRAGWTHEQPNHPADPLRIRVPRDPWHQAVEAPPDKWNDAPASRLRDPGHHRRDAGHINGLDALLEAFREQLDRERSRTDIAETELRATRNELRARGEERAAAVARAELLQAEAERLREQISRQAAPAAAVLAAIATLRKQLGRLIRKP